MPVTPSTSGTTRRTLLAALTATAVGLAALATPAPARAAWPDRPITMVVPWARVAAPMPLPASSRPNSRKS